MRDTRKLLAGVMLILIGALLAALVAVTLRAAERRFDRAEAGLDAQDEQLAALATAYEAAAARDADLPDLEEIIGALADDLPQPLPGPPGEPGRDGRDGVDGKDGVSPPDDPDPDDPELDDPEVQDAEIQDGEVDDPEVQDPETQDPEVDDPDPNDPANLCPPPYVGTPIHIGNYDAFVCVLIP